MARPLGHNSVPLPPSTPPPQAQRIDFTTPLTIWSTSTAFFTPKQDPDELANQGKDENQGELLVGYSLTAFERELFENP
jgi:hypothetical protein